jgi:predicted acetyltransferase
MEEYIARLKNHAGGIGLPDGHVPASTYWLVEEGAVIGHANIRHRLTPSLERRGGHIGYAVRPTKQGRGYGTTILALALRQARTLGIDRVLVTCDKTNVASRRVIEKNSGILQDQIHMEGQSVPILRFWIDNRPASSH